MKANVKLALLAGTLSLAVAQGAMALALDVDVDTFSYVEYGFNTPLGEINDRRSSSSTISLGNSFSIDDVGGNASAQARVGDDVGVASEANAFTGDIESYGSAGVVQRYTLDLDAGFSFGEWDLDFGWDGSLMTEGDAEAGYTVSATAYLVSSNIESIASPFSDEMYGHGSSTLRYLLDDFGHSNSISGNDFLTVDDSDNLSFLVATSAVDYFDSLVIELAMTVNTYAPGDGSANADFLNTFGITGGASAPSLGVTPVPVPAAVWFLASGLLGFMGMRRRAQAQALKSA